MKLEGFRVGGEASKAARVDEKQDIQAYTITAPGTVPILGCVKANNIKGNSVEPDQ